MKAATAAAERHSNAITAASRQPRHGLQVQVLHNLRNVAAQHLSLLG